MTLASYVNGSLRQVTFDGAKLPLQITLSVHLLLDCECLSLLRTIAFAILFYAIATNSTLLRTIAFAILFYAIATN